MVQLADVQCWVSVFVCFCSTLDAPPETSVVAHATYLTGLAERICGAWYDTLFYSNPDEYSGHRAVSFPQSCSAGIRDLNYGPLHFFPRPSCQTRQSQLPVRLSVGRCSITFAAGARSDSVQLLKFQSSSSSFTGIYFHSLLQ